MWKLYNRGNEVTGLVSHVARYEMNLEIYVCETKVFPSLHLLVYVIFKAKHILVFLVKTTK